MREKEIRFYEFGEFRLDARRRILTKNGAPVPLKNRHLELLLLLLENEGRILSHDELIEKIWRGAFIEQSNLKKGISALRRALEEAPGESAFIRTVPRVGYGFVAPVRARPDEAESCLVRETAAEILIEEIIEDDRAVDSAAGGGARAGGEPFPARALPAGQAVRRRRPAVWIAGAALLFFGAAALAAWLAFGAAKAPDFGRMRVVPLTSLGSVGGGGLVARGGGFLYFASRARGLTSLWLKDLKTGAVRQLWPPQKGNVYASELAPDDRSVYFWLVDDAEPARSGVYNLAFDGGEPRKITDREWGVMRFAPDGRRVAYVRRGIDEQNRAGLFTAAPDGTDEKLVFGFEGRMRLSSVDWSPDGRFLTYAAERVADNRHQYFIAQVPAAADGDAAAAEEQLVAPRAGPIFSAFWMPDGRGLAVSAVDESTKLQQIWYLSYPAGEWRRVTGDLNWYWSARPTADGRGLAVIEQRDEFSLWTGDADGRNFRRLTFDTLFYQPDASWTGDGKILYAARADGNSDVWEMSADGRERRRLTFDAASDRSPQVTPDGGQVLFLSGRGGSPQIWRMPRAAADDAQARPVTNAGGEVGRFRVLSDGRTVVYSVYLAGKGWSLFKKAIDADDFQALPYADAPVWDVSPDGARIAYLAQTKNGGRTRVASLEDGRPLAEFALSGYDALVWSKDGESLLFDRLDGDREEIMRQPLEGDAPQRVTDFDSDENIWNFDLSPDGRRIVARRVRQFFDVILIKFDSD